MLSAGARSHRFSPSQNVSIACFCRAALAVLGGRSQIVRVARARGVPVADIEALVRGMLPPIPSRFLASVVKDDPSSTAVPGAVPQPSHGVSVLDSKLGLAGATIGPR